MNSRKHFVCKELCKAYSISVLGRLNQIQGRISWKLPRMLSDTSSTLKILCLYTKAVSDFEIIENDDSNFLNIPDNMKYASGYASGWWDNSLKRVSDIFL